MRGRENVRGGLRRGRGRGVMVVDETEEGKTIITDNDKYTHLR